MSDDSNSVIAIDKYKLANLKQGWVSASAVLKALPCSTAEQYETCAEHLKMAQACLKFLEEERLEYTAPINATLSEVNKTYRETRQPVEEAKEILAAKMGAFKAEQKRLAAQAQAEARAAAEVGAVDKVYEALAKAPVVVEAPKGIAERVSFEVEVFDEAALERRFLCADTKALKAFAATLTKDQERIELPGVRFVRKVVTYSTGK